MKTLFLMRHAKSSWKDSSMDDFDRPLNKRGKNDAPLIGKILKGMNLKIDAIYTSLAKRAVTTAEIVSEKLNFPRDKFFLNKNIYEADSRTLLKIVQDLPEEYDSVLMFGHNPGFTTFQNFLTEKYLDNIPTAGIVKISFDLNSWRKVNADTGKLEFIEYPKKHK